MTDSGADAPLMGQGLTWENMACGSSFRTAARTITETDLMAFVHVAGFTEPLFYDAGHAAGGGYTGRLVPGALVYVLAEGLILQTNVLHGTGLAFMHMEYSVKSPTYVGDTLHVVVTTLQSRPSSRPGRGVVTTRCAVINQHGAEVAVFTPVRLIRGRDYAEAVPVGRGVT
jgi:acyl dehydratase